MDLVFGNIRYIDGYFLKLLLDYMVLWWIECTIEVCCNFQHFISISTRRAIGSFGDYCIGTPEVRSFSTLLHLLDFCTMFLLISSLWFLMSCWIFFLTVLHNPEYCIFCLASQLVADDVISFRFWIRTFVAVVILSSFGCCGILATFELESIMLAVILLFYASRSMLSFTKMSNLLPSSMFYSSLHSFSLFMSATLQFDFTGLILAKCVFSCTLARTNRWSLPIPTLFMICTSLVKTFWEVGIKSIS